MEPLEITIQGRNYTAMPMPDGSFDILDQKGRLGTINPVVNDLMFVKWVTAVLLSAELV